MQKKIIEIQIGLLGLKSDLLVCLRIEQDISPVPVIFILLGSKQNLKKAIGLSSH